MTEKKDCLKLRRATKSTFFVFFSPGLYHFACFFFFLNCCICGLTV